MFGDKFYKKINKLAPWQQTVFSLALAQRMYPNYQLFNDTSGRGNGRCFTDTLDILWSYLTVKGSRVDLSAELEKFEHFIPEPSESDSYGVYPALDACVALGAAYNSVICRIGEEAIEASSASLGTVAGFVDLLAERELSEDELYEHELIMAEMEFQVTLLDKVNQPRDADTILAIREFAAQAGVSNIGISLED
ncbi:YjaG family protein [Oceanisphaera pacifica]|uniref:YjaG family protein n=1 Tax=Oceanisphaera pacifica TaxID=2818389 RepID=A0ABS3NCT4_9GAMM|nr:YjaG family protein [Oceanisphaera pacifica]MBO1518350.1 YjaG family protein [Oceanisphaera pacifica]